KDSAQYCHRIDQVVLDPSGPRETDRIRRTALPPGPPRPRQGQPVIPGILEPFEDGVVIEHRSRGGAQLCIGESRGQVVQAESRTQGHMGPFVRSKSGGIDLKTSRIEMLLDIKGAAEGPQDISPRVPI